MKTALPLEVKVAMLRKLSGKFYLVPEYSFALVLQYPLRFTEIHTNLVLLLGTFKNCELFSQILEEKT